LILRTLHFKKYIIYPDGTCRVNPGGQGGTIGKIFVLECLKNVL